MKLINWEPIGEMDRWFEDFPVVSLPKFGWDMAIDLYEEQDNVIVKMNLPGIDPDKVNVSVEDDILRVSGSREEEKEQKEKRYYSKEIRHGSFERAVRLPKSVDNKKIDAEYKNGILKITMPIMPKEKGTTVKIKVTK